MATISDVTARMDIRASAALTALQDVVYEEPPPKVIPLRHYRAQMNPYRIANGIPVAPPVLDCRVPVIVHLNREGAWIPNLTRQLPTQINTLATLRWIAADPFVVLNADSSQMWWLDTDSNVAWNSYTPWQPVLARNFNYRFANGARGTEVLYRSALVFQAVMGTCMDAKLSTLPDASVEAVEFFFVFWPHTFATGQSVANFFDTGDAVRSILDIPKDLSDSCVGARLRLHSPQENKLMLHQGSQSLTLPASQTATGGRPVIVRLRFGQQPLIAWWGPKNTHQSLWVTTSNKAAQPVRIATNYILGRQKDLLSRKSNAGMHLYEINYYDHQLTQDQVDNIVHRLSAAYAVQV